MLPTLVQHPWLVASVLALILVWFVVSYNRFVAQRTLVQNAWANVDTELRRRYDLIPNLVECVRGYAAHERQVLETLTRTRADAVAATGSPGQQAQAEASFVAALRQVFAVAESYPQLRASQNFLALQQELSNTEDRIQAARRFFNANVQAYNRRVHSFPSMLVALGFGFADEEFFEIEPALRRRLGEPVRVDFAPPSPTSPGSDPAGPHPDSDTDVA